MVESEVIETKPQQLGGGGGGEWGATVLPFDMFHN